MLPWVALAPLVLLADRPKGAWWAWLSGALTWALQLYWIAPTLVSYGGLGEGLSVVLLSLLCLYLGAAHAVFVAVGRLLWRSRPALALVALPALWVLLERGRGLPIDRFPWNLAAYAWVELPGALPLAAWIGAYGVSYLLVLANVGLALGVRRRGWDLAVLSWLIPPLLAVTAGRFAPPLPDPGALEARLIQPDSPITDDAAAQMAAYRRLMDLSTRACDGGGRLLIWPESAAFPQRWEDGGLLRLDLVALNAGGCPVIFNNAVYDDGWRNSLLLVAGGEVAGRYDKRRLVPYGETVPLATVLPFVGTLARQAGSFVAGSDVGLLEIGGERLAAAICYEVVFPEAVAEQVRAGAGVLVTVTNDAWYGDSSAPHQHFRAVRFRAAETRRPLLRAALTGVSATVDANGRVLQRLGVGDRGVLSAAVAAGTGSTPYVRAPWLVPWASGCVVALAIVSALRRRSRPSRRWRSEPPAAPADKDSDR